MPHSASGTDTTTDEVLDGLDLSGPSIVITARNLTRCLARPGTPTLDGERAADQPDTRHLT